jgi:hypothetical protein
MMKTFKLISLQILEDAGLIEINLMDGLAINKEDDQHTWLLEVLTDQSYQKYFQSLLDGNGDLIVQVIISRRENAPAFFKTKLLSIKPLGNHISILFEGTLNNRSTNDYAELLLAKLIEQGLSGNDLLSQFKEQLITKPVLVPGKS